MAEDVKCVNLGNGFSRMSGVCTVTGEIYQIDLAHEDIDRWHRGELVQDVFPQLSDDQRKFLISKLTPAEFNELFDTED